MVITELTHNGPVFEIFYGEDPEYTELDAIINKTPISEMAKYMLWKWAAINEKYTNDKTFCKNAFKSIKKFLPDNLQNAKFPEDFNSLIVKMQRAHEIRKARIGTKEVKEERKQLRDYISARHAIAIVNGKEVKFPYLVEPDGFFIGRGNSPLRGCWKYKVEPEDITINFISHDKNPPKAPDGHKWKEIVRENAQYIFKYKMKLGEDGIYLNKGALMSASSEKVSEKSWTRFENARKLIKDWPKLTKYIKDEMEAGTEEAYVLWLISETGIRMGNEHSEAFENGTVGASSLLVKNITSIDDNEFSLKFLGKDSMEYKNTIKAPSIVISFLKNKIKNKGLNDKIFDTTPGKINNFIQAKFPYATAKLLRTSIATKTFMEEIKKKSLNNSMTKKEIKSLYDEACLIVSKKLNHKRTLPPKYKEQTEKFKAKYEDRLEAIKNKQKELEETLKGAINEGRIKLLKSRIKEKKDKYKALKEEYSSKLSFRKNASDIALGTARSAYSSPLIAYSMCKDLDLDLNFFYNKGLQEKFSWCKDVAPTYWKNFPKEEYTTAESYQSE